MTLLKRILCAVVLFALITAIFAITVGAKDGIAASLLIDDANLIKKGAAVTDAIADFERSTGLTLYIVTTNISYATPYDFKISTAGNVIVLIIEKGYPANYYELFTYGDPHGKISDTEAERILDDSTVYNEIKWGDVDSGVLRFIELSEKAYTGILQESVLKTIVISMALAMVIAVIPVVITVVKYKRKLKSAVYPLERYARLDLDGNQSSDAFIGSFVTRTRINTSSGGGSRSGGGRSGGGGGSRGRR